MPPFYIRIQQIVPHGARIQANPSDSLHWDVQVKTSSRSSYIRLRDPLAALPELVSDDGNDEPAKIIAWYLENHPSEPFEKTKAETARKLISTYGSNLASQIAETGLVPQDGDVQLQVVTSRSEERKDKNGGTPIQHLHWEVLEDPEVWSTTGRSPRSVSVVRSVQSVTGRGPGQPPTNLLAEHRDGLGSKKFNILLVVSRPCPEKDVDYQLVANALMGVIDQLPPQPQTTLTILRPPTWQAFQDHLRDHPHLYDLVHFDMKGDVHTVAGRPTAVLEFCQPGKHNPLRQKPDYRTGDQVGQELATAGVHTVVLNACDSASFRHASSGSNLAEVLLGHGVQSVVAMAYRVVEEGVEIFMGSFYQSLLAHGMTVTDAARTARSELLRNQSRRAHYMLTVQLADYIVPVVYVSSTEADANTTSLEKAPLASVRRTLESMKQAVPSQRLSPKAKTHPPRLLSGRDCDIVNLETLLPVARLVLLHGQGGIGKTELLRYVCRWWKSSGWIDTSVYIDFDDLEPERTETYRSMSDVVASIAQQLHLSTDERSEKDVINRLQRGKHLLVFDSADVFEDPIQSPGIGRETLTGSLKAFIRAAARGQSMVIVAARLDTTSIADIPSPHHKYPLSGLSVLNSVSLLQALSCSSVSELPDTFHRRENIDSLRRATIVLEGNPAAIKLVAPELKMVNYDGEKFFSTMFYDVFKELAVRQSGPSDSRFAQSLNQALCSTSFIDTRKTLIKASQFAPFFNVMPKDLTMYYWFLYLSVSRHFTEGNFEHWISEQFLEIVNKGRMAQNLRLYWSETEDKLMRVGILSHATVTTETGEAMPCYHVHPMYTLLSRALMSDEIWKEARFAFVRQALVWGFDYHARKNKAWAKVEWDGLDARHEDHLHNWRATALAWAVQDGKPLVEVERMGVSLVDCVDMVLTRAEWGSPRAVRLLAPHYRAYVLRAVTTALLRPGSVPTGSDLQAILTYTWGLWELEESVIKSTTEAKSALVQAALGAVDRWRAAGGRDLPRSQEISYHQLRYAEAQIAHDEGDLPHAKALFERNLSTEPVAADLNAAGILRRCYAKSLLRWGACAAELLARDGKIPDFEQRMKEVAESCILVGKPENMMNGLAALMAENPAQVATASLRDLFVAVLEAERETVAKFADFTQTALNMPVLELVADFIGAVWQGLQPRDGRTITRGGKVDVPEDDHSEEEGHQGASRDTQALVNQLSGVLASAGRRRKRNDDTHQPYLHMLRDNFRSAEADLREIAGDNRGAAQAMQAGFAREALSSTQNTGWEHLASMHLNMYRLAVESTPPDYRAALAHLKEDWNQHRGVGMAKMQECYAHLRFATCYHALGQVADAARSVIKVYQIGNELSPGDVPTGNVAGVQEWLCEQIVGMEALRVFLRRRAVLFNMPQAVGLGLRERFRMRTIMGVVTDIVEERRKLRETVRDMKEMLGELRELMAERNEDGMVAQIDETMEAWD